MDEHEQYNRPPMDPEQLKDEVAKAVEQSTSKVMECVLGNNPEQASTWASALRDVTMSYTDLAETIDRLD